MYRKVTLGACLAAIVLFVPSLSPVVALASQPSATPAQAAAATVNATETPSGSFVFQPPSITISVGQSVTFKNTGQAPHTATADDNSWDSGNLDAGQSFTTPAFKTPGTVAYSCTYHKALGMVGTIVVTGAPQPGGATTPTTASSPSATVAALGNGLPPAPPSLPAPPSQKYFPKIAGLLLLVALLFVARGYMGMKKRLADKG